MGGEALRFLDKSPGSSDLELWSFLLPAGDRS
jgi:hypothetical protein